MVGSVQNIFWRFYAFFSTMLCVNRFWKVKECSIYFSTIKKFCFWGESLFQGRLLHNEYCRFWIWNLNLFFFYKCKSLVFIQVLQLLVLLVKLILQLCPIVGLVMQLRSRLCAKDVEVLHIWASSYCPLKIRCKQKMIFFFFP